MHVQFEQRKDKNLQGCVLQALLSQLNHPWTPLSAHLCSHVSRARRYGSWTVLDQQCQFLVCKLLPFKSSCVSLPSAILLLLFQNYRCNICTYHFFLAIQMNIIEYYKHENRCPPSPNPSFLIFRGKLLLSVDPLTLFFTDITVYIYKIICVHTHTKYFDTE